MPRSCIQPLAKPSDTGENCRAQALPKAEGEVVFRRIGHFGNWLRLRLEMAEGSTVQLLATLHLKG